MPITRIKGRGFLLSSRGCYPRARAFNRESNGRSRRLTARAGVLLPRSRTAWPPARLINTAEMGERHGPKCCGERRRVPGGAWGAQAHELRGQVEPGLVAERA